MMTLWRFWLEHQSSGRIEAVELLAPSEGQAVQAILALRPGARILEVARRPRMERAA